jgi:putative addiction module killer protein
MYTIEETDRFRNWIKSLRDRQARAVINVRLRRLERGNLGDVKTVGGGGSELRVKHGPGYRVYVAMRGNAVVVLLCGGDKGTQTRDIADAMLMVRDMKV